MLRCAASFVIAAYDKCASFLADLDPVVGSETGKNRPVLLYELMEKVNQAIKNSLAL
jgi:hypothetical protein